ncbi:MAG: ferrous iron transport protein A [bacterium]
MITELPVISHDEGSEGISLLMLRPGQTGCVCDVVGDSGLVHRLREMGLCCGAEVKMIRSGSPCIIGLGRQRLGVRLDELASVIVKTSSDACRECQVHPPR